MAAALAAYQFSIERLVQPADAVKGIAAIAAIEAIEAIEG